MHRSAPTDRSKQQERCTKNGRRPLVPPPSAAETLLGCTARLGLNDFGAAAAGLIRAGAVGWLPRLAHWDP